MLLESINEALCLASPSTDALFVRQWREHTDTKTAFGFFFNRELLSVTIINYKNINVMIFEKLPRSHKCLLSNRNTLSYLINLGLQWAVFLWQESGSSYSKHSSNQLQLMVVRYTYKICIYNRNYLVKHSQDNNIAYSTFCPKNIGKTSE